MIKICICIGEGKSERYFLPSLLKNKFKFKELTEKHNFIFNKNEVFWLFPFPPCEIDEPSGGKSRFYNKQIYRDADSILDNIKYLLHDNYEVYYFIFRDVDSMNDDDCKVVENEYYEVFKESKVRCKLFKCIFQKQEIEAWFIAGLYDQFPLIKDYHSAKFKNLLKCDPEVIGDPKKELMEVLDDDILDQTILISDHFGEFIDINIAKSRSKSFELFLNVLTEYDLI